MLIVVVVVGDQAARKAGIRVERVESVPRLTLVRNIDFLDKKSSSLFLFYCFNNSTYSVDIFKQ